MMDPKSQMQAHILEKAVKDENFRASLLADPKMTLEKEFGITLPEALKVIVVEEKPDAFYLVLPARSATGSADELTEAELNDVAAGGNAWYDEMSSNLCPKLTFPGTGCNPH